MGSCETRGEKVSEQAKYSVKYECALPPPAVSTLEFCPLAPTGHNEVGLSQTERGGHLVIVSPSRRASKTRLLLLSC